MKNLVLILSIVFSFALKANNINELLVPNNYELQFKKAYSLNPSVPKGILEAIAFTQSRFTHLDEAQEESCVGYPRTFGVMGLVENGKNYFRNNLIYISQLSGYSVEDIKHNPEKSILAYAKAFSSLQTANNVFGNNIADYNSIFVALSELPLENDIQNDFAMNAHLYQLYWFLEQGEFQDYYGFPDYNINIRTIFGSNYDVVSASSIIISANSITNGNGNVYKTSGVGSNLSIASPDYPPALWNPTTCNYSSRSGTAISAITIHFMQGSYAGSISWFKNCSANVSAHYNVRSSDGQITQMVLESDKAWHVGNHNPYTIGIENEGYISTPSWFTTAMYNSNAGICKDACVDNSINPLRCYYGPGCSGGSTSCEQGSCVKIKGHQMFSSQSHSDPGPNWNWERFYKLINNTPTVTNITTNTGSFFDTGGSSANYSSDERKLWLFQPTAGGPVTLNFTSFSVENNYDHLFIYDGANTSAPLIGKYTGNVSPGSVISTGNSLLVEFRSDCATTNTGWVANYSAGTGTTSSGGGTTTPTDIIPPTTAATSPNIWQTTNFTETFTDADNTGGSGLDKSFYQVIDFNGTEWRANYTRGFFSDNFDNAIHPEWTTATGTWGINSNALEQSDEVSTAASNTNIYAALTQTLSNRYLYNFKGKINGTGSNRRAGFHFFIDNPTLPNRNNSYFVYFRLSSTTTPTASVEIYKTVNDAFGSIQSLTTTTMVPNQWYDFKVVFDRISGKIDVYQDNKMVNTWTDPTPHTVGDYISFRSGNCNWALDEIKVYRSRPVNSVTVSVGSGNGFDARYQNPNPTTPACKVKSIVSDVAGNLSSIYYDDVNIDWTAPTSLTSINDGLAVDINTVVTSDSLSANWPVANDPNSAVSDYFYSIGTSVGATNTLTWTSSLGTNNVTAKLLSLTVGQVYYFNVKAVNGAGIETSIISSNGQTVVAAPTQTVNSIKENEESKLVKVYPNPFTQNFDVSIDLTTDSDLEMTVLDALGKEIITYQSKESRGTYKKTIDVNSLGLSNGTYFLRVNINKKQLFKKVVKS